MRHLFGIFTLFILVFFSTTVNGQDTEVPRTSTFPGIQNPAFPYAKPEKVGMSTENLDKLGNEITSWVANGELVGAELLIIKDGKAVFHEAYGWSDRENKIPVERNSIWSIKSMTKPFTATAILMLAEEGKLSLDDPVSRYIPGFAGDERTTIGHLISHTTGYKQIDYGIGHANLKDWILEMALTPPTGKFGEYEYSDFGFGAAGYVVELVSGIPIDDFISDQILKPLDLDQTTTEPIDKSSWLVNLNDWYVWDSEAGKFHLRHNSKQHPWSFFPASSGMYSTAIEYAKFVSIFLNGGKWNDTSILQKESVEKMIKPHAYKNQLPMYGYGWRLSIKTVDPDDTVLGHGGYDGTRAYAYPGEDLIVIYMNHSRRGDHLSVLTDRIFMYGISDVPIHSFLSEANEEIYKSLIQLPEHQAHNYTGFYQGKIPDTNKDFLIYVEYQDQQLQMRMNKLGYQTGLFRHLAYLGNDQFILAKFHNNKLTWIDKNAIFKFIRNEDEIISIESIVNGNQEFFAKRVDKSIVLSELDRLQNRKFIDDLIRMKIKNEGVDRVSKLSQKLHAARPDSIVFAESLLNNLGYRFLSKNQYGKAIAVFEMNVEGYPKSANVYDSLADAYHEAGYLKEARRNYERAVELAEQQGGENIEAYRRKLKQVIQQLEEQ